MIPDLDKTREAIVKGTKLYRSIIIVKVGSSDFRAMEFLNSNSGALHSPVGEVTNRNIVHFMPFIELQNVSKDALTQCVLTEILQQVVGYFNTYRLLPPKNPAVTK